ncbi:hypothetical protein, partial [Clostridium butyricum]
MIIEHGMCKAGINMVRTLIASVGVKSRGRKTRASGVSEFLFQAEDGIRDEERSRGLENVYKRKKKY